ncbi:F-box domain-containing protein [Favolaschia claudopus]|uniref:F-box domain-containing protein n=1 Tax=Favolaschia claudopus TaxID=2862362 RepID=A0AAW0E6I7_9AGAR
MAAPRYPPLEVLAKQAERVKHSSRAEIQRLIADSGATISSLDTQITALQSKIAQLLALRDHECAAATALRHFAAPVRTLPAELLSEIFLLSMLHDDDARHIQDAYRLSHVCSEWRAVAHDTSRLWTGHISVCIAPDSSKEEKSYLVFRAWLARSAPHTLSIAVRCRQSERSLVSIPTHSHIAEVIRVAPRWRFLDLCSIPGVFLQQLCRAGTLDALEELDIWTVELAGAQIDLATISCFLTAPRLRKLTTSSNCPIPMPWKQLTDITLTIQHPDLVSNILMQSLNVVRASFRVNASTGSTTQIASRCELNYLRHLSLTTIGADGLQFMWLLDLISAPALDELSLSSRHRDSPHWVQSSFTAFQLCSPNITKLVIAGHDMRIPPPALHAALRHAPALTQLTLDDCSRSFDHHVLHALTYKTGVPPLVPRLQTLNLTCLEISGMEDVVASMIGSRWWTDEELASYPTPPTVTRWVEVNLDDCSWFNEYAFTESFKDAMETLRRTGLAVVVDTK